MLTNSQINYVEKEFRSPLPITLSVFDSLRIKERYIKNLIEKKKDNQKVILNIKEIKNSVRNVADCSYPKKQREHARREFLIDLFRTGFITPRQYSSVNSSL
ncbi:hypothetical protein [Aliivibrio fischeri]|uniref:hypothetical protein n=1 Tax=Aliivibrio fischeri TaxID=668 RepID=UPI0007C53FEB|nr:hypothetical protein [Aliivibrio fischeri]